MAPRGRLPHVLPLSFAHSPVTVVGSRLCGVLVVNSAARRPRRSGGSGEPGRPRESRVRQHDHNERPARDRPGHGDHVERRGRRASPDPRDRAARRRGRRHDPGAARARSRRGARAAVGPASARRWRWSRTAPSSCATAPRSCKLAQQVDGVVVDQGELRVLLHTDGSLAAVVGHAAARDDQAELRVVAARGARPRARPAVRRGAARSWRSPRPARSAAGRPSQVASTPELAGDHGARAPRARAGRRPAAPRCGRSRSRATRPRDPLSDPSIADLRGAQLPGLRRRRRDRARHQPRPERRVRLSRLRRDHRQPPAARRPARELRAAPHRRARRLGARPHPVQPGRRWRRSTARSTRGWPNNATTTRATTPRRSPISTPTARSPPGDVRPGSSRAASSTTPTTTTPSRSPRPTSPRPRAVNAFFMVNWMHDWWYDSGFTEATGNAQLDNLGRGGVAGDPLLVTSQAGANTGLRNNADMSTPADGARPRMRMFLWTAGTDHRARPRRPARCRSEAFAAGPRNFDLTGDLVAVTDATAPTDDGCQPITTTSPARSRWSRSRGVCGSAATVNNAKAAGAIGVILADGASDDPRAFAGSAAANIPGLAIGKTDGAALAAALAAGPVTVDAAERGLGPRARRRSRQHRGRPRVGPLPAPPARRSAAAAAVRRHERRLGRLQRAHADAARGRQPRRRLRDGAVRARRRHAQHRVLRHPPVPVQPRPDQERPQLPPHRRREPAADRDAGPPGRRQQRGPQHR